MKTEGLEHLLVATPSPRQYVAVFDEESRDRLKRETVKILKSIDTDLRSPSWGERLMSSYGLTPTISRKDIAIQLESQTGLDAWVFGWFQSLEPDIHPHLPDLIENITTVKDLESSRNALSRARLGWMKEATTLKRNNPEKYLKLIDDAIDALERKDPISATLVAERASEMWLGSRSLDRGALAHKVMTSLAGDAEYFHAPLKRGSREIEGIKNPLQLEINAFRQFTR